MTRAARKPVRRQAEPRLESQVYDGGRLLGVIKPRGETFVATMASGSAIAGTFAAARDAMKAICADDRRPREAAEAEAAASPDIEAAHA